MIVCPHCGKDINSQVRSSWWKYEPGPKTNLGCGTFILIAIVVAAVVSRSTESVTRLEQQVNALDQKIDSLSKGIEKLGKPGQEADLKKL